MNKNTIKKFYHVNPIICIAFIAGFALILRLLIGTFYYNSFDLAPYNIPWAIGTRDGVFSVYSNVKNLDYPPLFPFLLSFVGDGVANAYNAKQDFLLMFLIKLVPILFDTALVVLLYFIGLHYSQTFAILLSCAWALNISAIFNCSFWGQTDSMLLFFILLMMVGFEKKMPVAATVCFALGCLTKLQMAYFAPLLLCELFFRYKPLRATRSLLIGLGAGILGWLPFIIGSKNSLLPFQIYLGGFGKYNFINVNAYNIYGLSNNNWVPDIKSMFGGRYNAVAKVYTGGFSYSNWSTVITVIIFAVLIFSYVYAHKKQIEIPVTLNAMLFMNSIFMFTTKMHERYQIPVLILTLLCFVVCHDRRFFYGFIGIALITFANQATLLFSQTYPDTFTDFFFTSQPFFSIINILLYMYLLWLYIDYHMSAVSLKKEELVV